MHTPIKAQCLSAIGHQPSPPWLCPATLAQMEMIHGIKNISKEGVRRYEAMGGSWRLGCRVWWCWRNAGMVRDWIGVRYRGFGLPMVSAQFWCYIIWIQNVKHEILLSSTGTWPAHLPHPGIPRWGAQRGPQREVWWRGEWGSDCMTIRLLGHLGVHRSSKLAVTKYFKRVKTLVTFLMHSKFIWKPIKRDWWKRKTSAICKTSVYLRQLYSSISSKIVILCKNNTCNGFRRQKDQLQVVFFVGFTLMFTFTGSCFKLENHIQDTTKIWRQIIIIYCNHHVVLHVNNCRFFCVCVLRHCFSPSVLFA